MGDHEPEEVRVAAVTAGRRPGRYTEYRNLLFGAQRYPKIILAAVIAVGVITVIIDTRFASWLNVTNILRAAAPVGVAAVGQTIVLIGGNFDLSIGSTAGLTGLITAVLLHNGLGAPETIVLVLLIGMGLGLVNAVVVGIIRINPIIGTLGTGSVFYGAAVLATKGVPQVYPREGLTFLVTKRLGIHPSVFVYIGALVLFGVFLHLTVWGVRTYLLGANVEAARTSGVPTRQTVMLTYAISGLLAAVGGILLTVELGSGQPSGGQTWLLSTLAGPIIGGVAVTGGAGTLFGAFLGMVLISEINSALVFAGYTSFARELALGIAILLAMIVQADSIRSLLRTAGRRARRRTGEEPGE